MKCWRFSRDVLTAPEFRQDKIDFAKSQFRSGISRRNDNAAGIAQREFTNLLYGKTTPYGWTEEYATIDRDRPPRSADVLRALFFPGECDAGGARAISTPPR